MRQGTEAGVKGFRAFGGLTAIQTAWLIGAGFFSDVIDGFVACGLGVSNGGVTLPIALTTVLVAGRDDFLVLALVAGFISHAECFVITAILPEWRHDVATFYDALAIRAAARRSSRGIST